jgi:hypothetical protein
MTFLQLIEQARCDIDHMLATADECMAAQSRIRELSKFANRERCTDSKAEEESEKDSNPYQKQIDEIYDGLLARAFRELAGLLGRVAHTLAACPTERPQIRELRAEIERLPIFKRFQQMEWPGVKADLELIRGRFEEMRALVEARVPVPDPESQVRSGNGTKTKKRGRPAKFPAEVMEKAVAAKEAGQTNRECAKILYATSYPTAQQVKNVSSIFRHYRAHHSK